MLAILGVVVAVALIVAIARQNADNSPRPVPKTLPKASTPLTEASPDPTDLQLEVKELSFGDGGVDRTSIRVDHPDQATQALLREFLEIREHAAVATNTPLDCHAQIAKTSLISITCVSVPKPDPRVSDSGTGADAGVKPEPKYESLTLHIARGAIKQLSLQDVLTVDAGQAEVVDACKKAAEPDLACEWPPTDFAISPGGTLFLCHGSHCIDIDADDAPLLVRPEYR